MAKVDPMVGIGIYRKVDFSKFLFPKLVPINLQIYFHVVNVPITRNTLLGKWHEMEKILFADPPHSVGCPKGGPRYAGAVFSRTRGIPPSSLNNRRNRRKQKGASIRTKGRVGRPGQPPSYRLWWH